jgi:putative addiction module component (TIGR02574 family)
MNRSAAEVLEDARRLPPSELDWLIGELLDPGDGTNDGGIDEAWKVEIERRVAEIDSGTTVPVPVEDVLARMDARILARQRR